MCFHLYTAMICFYICELVRECPSQELVTENSSQSHSIRKWLKRPFSVKGSKFVTLSCQSEWEMAVKLDLLKWQRNSISETYTQKLLFIFFWLIWNSSVTRLHIPYGSMVLFRLKSCWLYWYRISWRIFLSFFFLLFSDFYFLSYV